MRNGKTLCAARGFLARLFSLSDSEGGIACFRNGKCSVRFSVYVYTSEVRRAGILAFRGFFSSKMLMKFLACTR